jgi:uncharacterized protein (DUF2267 family)
MVKLDEFVAKVQKRADLGSHEEAARVVNATLAALGEHLTAGEAGDLAAQLPPEMAQALTQTSVVSADSFGLDEFFRRVAEYAGIPLTEASLDARVVIGVLCESVTMGEIENVRAQLPEDIRQLFMVENEGDIPEVRQ